MKDFKDVMSSKNARLITGVIGVVVFSFLIFHAGVVFGTHRNPFGGPSDRSDMSRGFRPPFFPGDFEMPHGFIPNSHGAVGAITEITLPTFRMETREGTSQTISIGTSTIIRNIDDSADTSALSIGNQIIVIGDTNSEGHIGAKLIRILPAQMPKP